MACLGTLFSLDHDSIQRLQAFSADEERLEFVQEAIDPTYFNHFPRGWQSWFNYGMHYSAA